MPVFRYGEPCVACGGSHTLSLDDRAPRWRHWDYEFVCPVKAQTVRFRTLTWTRPRRPSAAALPVHPIDDPVEPIA
jgi:hypothetical protein